MDIKMNKEIAKIYAQARAERTKRSYLRVLVSIENEFTYRQIVSLLPLDTEFVVVDKNENLLETYLATVPDMLLVDPEAQLHEELVKIYALDNDHFVTLLADHMSQKEIMDALEAGAQGFLTRPYTERKVSHYLNVLNAAKAHRMERAYHTVTIQ